MKKYIAAGIITLSVFALASCRYDNTEDLYTTPNCDTTNATFAAFVEPVLADKCYSCHGQANYVVSGNNILLEGYVNMVDYVTTGAFMGSIKHLSGYEAMPDGEPQLDACTIAKLQKWVDDGAQDN